jgi:hypothetical protein
MKTPKLLSIIALLGCLALPLSAAEMMRLDAQPGGSKVRLEGTSTVHDWLVEGNLIGGYMEVGSDFPLEPGATAKPGKVDAKVNVFIVVRNLKSIEKDGAHKSDKMDEVMHERLKAQANPRIFYTLNELVLKEAPKAAGEPYVFDSTGELAVAGVTNKISMAVKIVPLGSKKLKITGEYPVKMTEFKVDRNFLLGTIKIGEEVKVIFTWTVGQRAAPAATK